MAIDDKITQAITWVTRLKEVKGFFTLSESWLFVNILGLILLWTLFYVFIKNKLEEVDKKNFIGFLVFGSVLTFIGIALYFINEKISIVISIIGFVALVIAPSYCGWVLIDFERVKDSVMSKFKKGKK